MAQSVFDDFRGIKVGANIHLVNYLRSREVALGVSSEEFEFTDTSDTDLAIIRLGPHRNTPLQAVLDGKQTLIVALEGSATFNCISRNGVFMSQAFEGEAKVTDGIIETDSKGVLVEVGDVMSWQNTSGRPVYLAELCTPPYSEGRYLNLDPREFAQLSAFA